MPELGRNITSHFSSPFPTHKRFGPDEEVEQIIIVARFVENLVPSIYVYVPNWDAEGMVKDVEIFSDTHALSSQTVKLSKNAKG